MAPNGSWKATAAATAPTSGSRLTNAPATSAGTRDCPYAKSENASSVPAMASPMPASTGASATGAGGTPSATTA
jgi:hypothetical protein